LVVIPLPGACTPIAEAVEHLIQAGIGQGNFWVIPDLTVINDQGVGPGIPDLDHLGPYVLRGLVNVGGVHRVFLLDVLPGMKAGERVNSLVGRGA